MTKVFRFEGNYISLLTQANKKLKMIINKLSLFFDYFNSNYSF